MDNRPNGVCTAVAIMVLIHARMVWCSGRRHGVGGFSGERLSLPWVLSIFGHADNSPCGQPGMAITIVKSVIS